MDAKAIEKLALPVALPDHKLDHQQAEERRELVRAVRAINATELFGQNYELTFVLDRETRRPLMRIVDRQTREVIRQLPPEYAVRLVEELRHR